jgi:hypothetical protein
LTCSAISRRAASPNLSVEIDSQDLAASSGGGNSRLLGVGGKGGDAIDGLFDILKDFLTIDTFLQLRNNAADAFGSSGGDLLDAIDPLQPILNNQDDAFLDLLGA